MVDRPALEVRYDGEMITVMGSSEGLAISSTELWKLLNERRNAEFAGGAEINGWTLRDGVYYHRCFPSWPMSSASLGTTIRGAELFCDSCGAHLSGVTYDALQGQGQGQPG